jgi:hypothetical protein
MEHSSTDINPTKNDGDHNNNRYSTGDTSSPARGGTSMMMKRDSIMADDLADFDPANLEAEDDWRDIFDDDDGSNNTGGGGGGGGGGGRKPSGPLPSASRLSGGALATDRLDSSDPRSARALMPPPASASDNPRRSSSSESASSVPSLGGGEEFSSSHPPLDHSITRRKKTSQNMDRIERIPPTWHSDAADMPHRRAMVQDM